jgi:phosphatidylglycerophosphate synthase
MTQEAVHPTRGLLWENTPNAISLARLLATPILLAAVIQGREGLFKWLLLACLLSDILDGLIARAFHLRSKLGARLDSIADMLVAFISIAALFMFQRAFLAAHFWELSIVISLYSLEILAALLRYGKISSFHTIVNRIAAYSQGIFVMSLFLWGYRGWLFHPMIALTIVASVEEFLLLGVLPEWRSDVRGLYWVLADRGITSK